MTAHLLASVVLLAAIGASVAATMLTPTRWMSEEAQRAPLEQALPKSFGDWRVDAAGAAAVINPQTQQVLDKIYSDMLSRTYVDSKGYRVMLSIAYGKDQRDSMQLHYPEVCYPAQGFTVLSNNIARVETGFSTLDVRRLVTNLGGRRPEPVTYWTTVGNQAVIGGNDKKMAEMSYGFRGLIPDGLLFRVSSIDPVPAEAFAAQDRFVRDLVRALGPVERLRFAGIAQTVGSSAH